MIVFNTQPVRCKPRYTFLKFCGDLILGGLTCGAWWVWCLFRWLGNR